MASYQNERPHSSEGLVNIDEGNDRGYGSIPTYNPYRKVDGNGNEQQSMEANTLYSEEGERKPQSSDSDVVDSQRLSHRNIVNASVPSSDNTSTRSLKRKPSKPSLFLRVFPYISYAFVNIIISVPGLYGYAAVIFNNPAFSGHMNALSKLVIMSSCVHQLGFTLFSNLPFAIGTVQDAGLLFLSAIANIIANSILQDGGTIEEVILYLSLRTKFHSFHCYGLFVTEMLSHNCVPSPLSHSFCPFLKF